MRIWSAMVLAALIALVGPVAAQARPAAAPIGNSPRLACIDASGATHESPLPRQGERCAPVGVPVPPGWTWVAGAPGLNIYTHSALGTPPPGLVKLWVLYSFDTPKGGPGKEHLSAKQLEFHSCANGTFAVGTVIKYARPLGEGEVVESTQNDQLKQLEIPPDTASSWVWKSICAG
jgi:hypothetical protein